MSSETTLLIVVILAVGAALTALSIGLSVWVHGEIGGAIQDGKEYRERKARLDGAE